MYCTTVDRGAYFYERLTAIGVANRDGGFACDGVARRVQCGFKCDGFGIVDDDLVHECDAAGSIDVCIAPLACCIDIESDDEVTASEGLFFGLSGAAQLIGLGGAGIARLIWCGGRVGVVCWAAGGCACCGI